MAQGPPPQQPPAPQLSNFFSVHLVLMKYGVFKYDMLIKYGC